MTEKDPTDDRRVFVGDYVVADVRPGRRVEGEVTDIADGVATILDYAPDGSITDEVEVPVERCRLHPRGRDSVLARVGAPPWRRGP